MGKKRGTKNPPQTSTPTHHSISLRQETTRKIQTKGTAVGNPKFFLKLEHIQNLAVWANRDASVPSMGAFFGRRFAAAGEALGVQPDPSQVLCQRCETILQPGFNCTVRIERNPAKTKRRRNKKPNTFMQKNSVVYKCHFCSHKNLRRGTPKCHMKDICPSNAKPKQNPPAKPRLPEENSMSLDKIIESKDEIAMDTSISSSPVTPSVTSGATLLDAKRRKRNRSSGANKKSEESEDSHAAKDDEKIANVSSKRKRKSWTSLKEIAESNEHGTSRNVANLTIPFFL